MAAAAIDIQDQRQGGAQAVSSLVAREIAFNNSSPIEQPAEVAAE